MKTPTNHLNLSRWFMTEFHLKTETLPENLEGCSPHCSLDNAAYSQTLNKIKNSPKFYTFDPTLISQKNLFGVIPYDDPSEPLSDIGPIERSNVAVNRCVVSGVCASLLSYVGCYFCYLAQCNICVLGFGALGASGITAIAFDKIPDVQDYKLPINYSNIKKGLPQIYLIFLLLKKYPSRYPNTQNGIAQLQSDFSYVVETLPSEKKKSRASLMTGMNASLLPMTELNSSSVKKVRATAFFEELSQLILEINNLPPSYQQATME